MKKANGYTILQLVVVITVIGILAAITSVGYSNWRSSIAKTQVENDLKMVVSAMEDYRNYNNVYSQSALANQKVSDGNELVFIALYGNAKYCAQITNLKTGIRENIDQDGSINSGSCHGPSMAISISDGKLINSANNTEGSNPVIRNDYDCSEAVNINPDNFKVLCQMAVATSVNNIQSSDFMINTNFSYDSSSMNNCSTGTCGVILFSKYSSLDMSLYNSKTTAGKQYLRATLKVNNTRYKIPASGVEGAVKLESNMRHELALKVKYNGSSNSTEVRIYVNGQLSSSATIDGKFVDPAPDQPLSIGSLAGLYTFVGNIYSFDFYQYAD